LSQWVNGERIVLSVQPPIQVLIMVDVTVAVVNKHITDGDLRYTNKCVSQIKINGFLWGILDRDPAVATSKGCRNLSLKGWNAAYLLFYNFWLPFPHLLL